MNKKKNKAMLHRPTFIFAGRTKIVKKKKVQNKGKIK